MIRKELKKKIGMTVEALYKVPRPRYTFSSYSLLVSYSGQNSLPSVAHRYFVRLSRNLFKKQALAFLDRKFCHVLLKPDVIPPYQ